MRRVIDAYRRAYGGLSGRVWMLSAVAFVNRSGTMVLPFLALWLTDDRGLTPATAGAVIACYGIGGAAGSYLGGWLSDRIGAVASLQISLLGSGVGFLALAFMRETAQIVGLMVVLGVIAEAFRPAVMAAVSEAAGGNQARAFALLRLAVNVAMSIGPGLGGLLALAGYVWLFVVDAATCWLAAGALWWLDRRVQDGPPRDAASRSVDPVAPESIATAGCAPRSPWRDGPFLLLMLLVFFLACGFFQLMTTVPLTLRDLYGFREHTIGGLLAFNAVLVVVFEMLIIQRVERRDPLPVIGLGACLICLGLGMMAWGDTLAFAALTVVIWSVGEMLALPLLNVVVVGRANPANRGRYMGVFTMVFSAAFVVAPAAGMRIYDSAGVAALWSGVAALGPLLWLFALRLRRPLASP